MQSGRRDGVFVEPSNGMFARDAVYGWNDDASRFNFFCNAALEFLLQTGRQPDILHCHDWSSAEVIPSVLGELPPSRFVEAESGVYDSQHELRSS